MHDAVLTLDENLVIKTCNTAGMRILKVPILNEILEQNAKEVFGKKNEWLIQKLEDVKDPEEFLDAEIFISRKLYQ